MTLEPFTGRVRTHKRSSLRLGHVASVRCRCGWETEVRSNSGDETSRRVREAYDTHLLAPPKETERP